MIASYILIMLAGALITGLLFALYYQEQGDLIIENELKIAAYDAEKSLREADLDLTMQDIQKRGIRLSVIDIQGNVLFESYKAIGNHLDREEVILALEKGSAYVSRHSRSTGEYYKFYAYKTEINDNTYIVRTAKQLNSLSRYATRATLIILVFTVTLSIVLAWFLILRNISNIRYLEKIRSEFVSNVTHELKTPLTSIKGFADTLRQGAIKDEGVAEHFLDIIEIEADRLSALISDVMNLSSIENYSTETNATDCILSDILDAAQSIIQPLADRHKINLKIKEGGTKITLRVNFDRLKQLIINLLDNAIKYSNEGGVVTLDWEVTGNNIVFAISDDGIGIEQKHLNRIFERFYRVDKGRSRSRGGTGLGLSIAKHIVQLYKGEINVKSAVGQGTTFVITLPIYVN